jgi:hypothetical protein
VPEENKIEVFCEIIEYDNIYMPDVKPWNVCSHWSSHEQKMLVTDEAGHGAF